MRGEIAILPLEIQQWLRSSRFLQAQGPHFTNHDQMVARGMFSMDFAVKPMQATSNDRITQRRRLPLDSVPFVRALSGELVGNPDLLVGQDINGEPAGLPHTGIAG